MSCTRRYLIALIALAVLIAPATAHAQDRVRVAVMNFHNNSQWHWWGENLGWAAADELATQLVRSGRFTVVERHELEAILAEQEFGDSGRVEESTAAQLGQVLGVQLMITGSITKFSVDTKGASFGGIGARYTEAESEIDVRVVNTVTGEILAVAEGEGQKRLGSLRVDSVNFEQSFDAGLAQESLRPAVEDAVEDIVRQADRFDNLKPVLPPATIVGSREGSFYIDRGDSAGVTVGQEYAVLRVVDEIRDGDGNLLDQITDEVGVLRVTRVLSSSSICELVSGEAVEGDRLVAR